MRQREKRDTLFVFGYTELLRANKKAEKEARLFSRHELKAVGDIVREDASRRFEPIDSKSAAGYKTRVRIKGIAVEQSKKKTTGKHGAVRDAADETGALAGALRSKRADLARAFDRALSGSGASMRRSGN